MNNIFFKKVDRAESVMADVMMAEGTEIFLTALKQMARTATERFGKAGMKAESDAWAKFRRSIQELRSDLDNAAEKARG